jgi:stearoyl-CoA desaturase (delta-9 desaturase)
VVHDRVVAWAWRTVCGPGWQVLLFTWWHHITIASVTIFLHRAQAHRALELHAIPSHFFRFWLWLTTGMVTKEWVAIHRKHHAKCETDDDPHSPQARASRHGAAEGSELYRAEANVPETLDKYGHNTPDDWLERNLYTATWQGVALMLVIDVALFGARRSRCGRCRWLWIPVTAAGIINGIGHYWGYRNFEARMRRPTSCPGASSSAARSCTTTTTPTHLGQAVGQAAYEFDIGWLYIRVLESGPGQVRKTPPQAGAGRVKAGGRRQDAGGADRQPLRGDGQLRASELRRAVRAELDGLKAQGAQTRAVDAMRLAKAWLHRDDDKIPQGVKPQLAKALRDSPQLAKLVAMREELRQLWTRTNVSPSNWWPTCRPGAARPRKAASPRCRSSRCKPARGPRLGAPRA